MSSFPNSIILSVLLSFSWLIPTHTPLIMGCLILLLFLCLVIFDCMSATVNYLVEYCRFLYSNILDLCLGIQIKPFEKRLVFFSFVLRFVRWSQKHGWRIISHCWGKILLCTLTNNPWMMWFSSLADWNRHYSQSSVGELGTIPCHFLRWFFPWPH